MIARLAWWWTDRPCILTAARFAGTAPISGPQPLPSHHARASLPVRFIPRLRDARGTVPRHFWGAVPQSPLATAALPASPGRCRLRSPPRQIVSRPASVNRTRHRASQSGRAPSRSHDHEDLCGLRSQASDSKTQKKPAVGRTELGDAKRPIRLDAKHAADPFRDQQTDAAEHHHHDGPTVRQQHHHGAGPFHAPNQASSQIARAGSCGLSRGIMCLLQPVSPMLSREAAAVRTNPAGRSTSAATTARSSSPTSFEPGSIASASPRSPSSPVVLERTATASTSVADCPNEYSTHRLGRVDVPSQTCSPLLHRAQYRHNMR
jgi:hypothetical protein